MRHRSLAFANVRQLLLALLTIGLLLRMGAGCEAMAAKPEATAAAASHCDSVPAGLGKPMKVDPANCAFCHAVPDAAATKDRPAMPRAFAPITYPIGDLVGLNGAPAPPPPKAV